MTEKVRYDWTQLELRCYFSAPGKNNYPWYTLSPVIEMSSDMLAHLNSKICAKNAVSPPIVWPSGIQKQRNKQKHQEFNPQLGISQWTLLTRNGTTPILVPHLLSDLKKKKRKKLQVLGTNCVWSEYSMCTVISVHKYSISYCFRVYRLHVIHINALNHDNSSMR